MTEADVEHATLEWLAALGWEVGHGPDGSPPDARTPGTERDTYRETALKHRLQGAIRRLNPHIPASAQDEACRQVLNEFAPNIRVLVTWQGGTESATLPELLPHGFGPQQLTTKE